MVTVLASKDLFGVFMVKEINEEKNNIRSDQFNNKYLNGVIHHVLETVYGSKNNNINKSLKEN